VKGITLKRNSNWHGPKEGLIELVRERVKVISSWERGRPRSSKRRHHGPKDFETVLALPAFDPLLTFLSGSLRFRTTLFAPAAHWFDDVVKVFLAIVVGNLFAGLDVFP
jgi:hypothetical protein